MSLSAEDIIRRVLEGEQFKNSNTGNNVGVKSCDIERGENQYKVYESKGYVRRDDYYLEMEVLERINKGDTHQWYVNIKKTDETHGKTEDILIPIGMLEKMLPDLMQAVYLFGSTDKKDRKTAMIRQKNRPKWYDDKFPDNDGERARIQAKFIQFMLDCKP